jgi:hypothetical protein
VAGVLKGIMDRVHYDAVLADLEARREKLVEDKRVLEDDLAQMEALILGIRTLLAGVDHSTKAVDLSTSLNSHGLSSVKPPKGASIEHAMTLAALRVPALVEPGSPLRKEEARISKAAGEAERVAVKSAETAAQRTAAHRAHCAAEATSLGVGVALEPGGMGLGEAVDAAAFEARHDQIALVARVMALRPGTIQASAATMVNKFLREGRVKKGDDLIIRLVKDGKIQNLPPMRQDDALPIRRTSQYGGVQ